MTSRRQSGGVRILLILCITVISSCQAAPSGYSGVFDGSAGRWVDLTHSFAESTIYWPTDTAGFQLQELAFGQTEGGWFYASYQLASAEHFAGHEVTNVYPPGPHYPAPTLALLLQEQYSCLVRFDQSNLHVTDGSFKEPAFTVGKVVLP